MFSQLCATLVLAGVTVLNGRSKQDPSTIVLFAVGVLITILSAFRVRSLRARSQAERARRVPQNAATDEKGDPSGSNR